MIIKAPDFFDCSEYRASIFLGGSIEMGKAEPWQDELSKLIEEKFADQVLILNPRRDDWDSSWKQEKDNKQFREQVEWELEAQDLCSLRCYYFDPKTQSPITLLELGLFSDQAIYESIVCCPNGFWRKGNVDIVCERSNIRNCDTKKSFYREILLILKKQVERERA